MASRLFVAATRQNEGKTMLCLGLVSALRKRGKTVGFIKPVGQRYVIEHGYKVDEDSVLMDRVGEMDCPLPDMSPVAIERGFTEKYIQSGGRGKLVREIRHSFLRCARGRELVLVEGTGHAGVGSVFDLSNAAVARILKAKVLLVSGGGIGRPIDEVMLNAALFRQMGVPIMGVIINKVQTRKYAKISRLVRQGFRRKGLEVLGVIPYRQRMSNPTIRQIVEATDTRVLFGKDKLSNVVERVIVGAMEPHNALNYITKGSLIITAGDREDIVLAAMSFHTIGAKKVREISGILLSGGMVPHRSILDLARMSGIPVLITSVDTYRIASEVHDLTAKIQPEDRQKIETAKELVEEFVDVNRIMARL